mgnify:CR=1 FL=1
MKLPDTPSRKDVLRLLAESSIFGNLGLFVGAGLSKAVAPSDGVAGALSWGELLESAAEKLGLNWSDHIKPGLSYPEIASALCRSYSQKETVNYDSARDELKWQLARLTDWLPDPELEAPFRERLTALSPAWVITTNYDLVVESILGNQFESLGPSRHFVARKGLVPVYHLHGIRTDPDSIVITQEDYVALFRPYDYRQTRLALTLEESATLFLGYSLSWD